LEEEKIIETIRYIPQNSFTVLDFIRVFKRLFSKDWNRLTEKFGQPSEKRKYTLNTYLSNRLDVYSQKPMSILQPFTRYSTGKFKDYRRLAEEDRTIFKGSWVALFKKKSNQSHQ